MSIIILKEKIINNLWLISILYGISSSVYWFPYNLFVINKIDNDYRTEYTVKSKIVTSITNLLSILCVSLYGKLYRYKDDKKIITISSIIPVLSVILLLIYKNNITVIIYNVCYVIFTSLLTLSILDTVLNIKK